MKKITITGFVGKDPDGKYANDGKFFVVFSVAINVGTKANPRTDWVDVACNDKLAETAMKYLQKGSRVLIEGFPSATAYINKEGKPVATLRVAAKFMEMLNSKDEEKPESNYGGAKQETHNEYEEDPYRAL